LCGLCADYRRSNGLDDAVMPHDLASADAAAVRDGAVFISGHEARPTVTADPGCELIVA
jgi:hypothetical protein